ncbi:MAG: 23S rRNA (guanosine(2251)-2'-O)-methyltransferase RlmB [Lysobacterales bacterium]
MSKDILAGIHAVESALRHDSDHVGELLVAEDSRNPRVKELVEDAKARGVRVHHRSAQALDKLTQGERHQGVVAFYDAPAALAESDLPRLLEQAGSAALFLVLDEITDPHNFGACLRSALAARATAVIVPKDRAAPTNATVRRASAGAADRVPIVRATNLARAMQVLRDAGVWITGLEGEAETSLYAQDLRGPVAIAMGAEDTGMRRLTREHCDFLARIPMPGEMESLNVSVAAGIALFEALRQRSASLVSSAKA